MFVSPQTVTVDGEEYGVVLSGFKQNGQIVRQFISQENGANSADVVAIFAKAGRPDVHITTVRNKGDSAQLRDPNKNVVSEYGYGSKASKP